jgi:hypothetical protein
MSSHFKILSAMVVVTCILLSGTETSASVSLRDSTISWRMYKYQTDANNAVVSGSFDGKTIVSRSFPVKIIENEYLKIIIMSGFGGRVLSMIYKPTGHEQLYQNPIGVPYLIDEDIFYYDWLMIYGGIFPTLSEPEHGKYWGIPWNLSIVKNTADTVSIAMSIRDSINYQKKPARYVYGATGMECTFTVSIISGRAALETNITLVNLKAQSFNYEYWTNAGMAPGSAPGNPRCTNGAEIITPNSNVFMADDYKSLSSKEKSLGNNIFEFNVLRWWKNWSQQGIAYANPKVINNFWGVINHDNEEGIIRVSKNDFTTGLKIWTFGYPQSQINPETNNDYARPFIELWAGASTKFFTPASFPGKSSISLDESYITTVGMTGVSNASRDVLANVSLNKTQFNGAASGPAVVSCSFVTVTPANKVHLLMAFRGPITTYIAIDTLITPDPAKGNSIVKSIPLTQLCTGLTALTTTFSTEAGVKLLETSTPVSFVGLTECVATAVTPRAGKFAIHPVFSGKERQYFPNGRECAPSDLGSTASGSSGVRLVYRNGKLIKRVVVGKAVHE